MPDGASEAGGVDEPDLPAGQLDHGVDGVPGGPRIGVDDHPLLGHQVVEQRRLPHVRPADDGEPSLLFHLRFGTLRDQVQDAVEELAGPSTMEG